MYFEFLFFRAHSRKRVERMYWSGWSLNSFTTCSNSVMVGTTGPIGSGLPQLGLPRLFAIVQSRPTFKVYDSMTHWVLSDTSQPHVSNWIHCSSTTIQGAASGSFPRAQHTREGLR